MLCLYYTVWKLCHGQIREGTFGSTFRTMVKMEISSHRYWGEDFRGDAFDVYIPLTDMYFFSHTGLGNPIWRKCYQGTFGSIWMAMVKKEISSDSNWKEDFCETAL